MANIKEKIETILEKGNLSQKELAEKLKVSPAQICRWRDKAEPKLCNCQKIDELYNELCV